jgi:hypothetical protein
MVPCSSRSLQVSHKHTRTLTLALTRSLPPARAALSVAPWPFAECRRRQVLVVSAVPVSCAMHHAVVGALWHVYPYHHLGCLNAQSRTQISDLSPVRTVGALWHVYPYQHLGYLNAQSRTQISDISPVRTHTLTCPTHPLTHPLTHSPTHSLAHSLTRTLTHSPTSTSADLLSICP